MVTGKNAQDHKKSAREANKFAFPALCFCYSHSYKKTINTGFLLMHQYSNFNIDIAILIKWLDITHYMLYNETVYKHNKKKNALCLVGAKHKAGFCKFVRLH